MSIQIFRIRLNSNKFQRFLPTDESVWKTDTLKMDCRPKLAGWAAPEVYIHNPTLESGDFFHLCSGAFVVNDAAAEQLREILEIAGELLPINYEGHCFSLLNVMECVNCLDAEKTEWVTGKITGAKIRIVRYQFDKRRLTESSLFKIPETAVSEMLCIEGLKAPEDEFKTQVESSGFRGLIFERIWADNEP